GLVAEGRDFAAFWAMPAGADQDSIFFRDPLPAEETPAPMPARPGIDLPSANPAGTPLGRASGRASWLAATAPGCGWLGDPTPRNDAELTAPGNQGEQHRMDSLTALEQKIGDLPGSGPPADGVMAETLTAGTRRMAGSGFDLRDPAGLDRIFAA